MREQEGLPNEASIILGQRCSSRQNGKKRKAKEKHKEQKNQRKKAKEKKGKKRKRESINQRQKKSKGKQKRKTSSLDQIMSKHCAELSEKNKREEQQ